MREETKCICCGSAVKDGRCASCGHDPQQREEYAAPVPVTHDALNVRLKDCELKVDALASQVSGVGPQAKRVAKCERRLDALEKAQKGLWSRIGDAIRKAVGASAALVSSTADSAAASEEKNESGG